MLPSSLGTSTSLSPRRDCYCFIFPSDLSPLHSQNLKYKSPSQHKVYYQVLNLDVRCSLQEISSPLYSQSARETVELSLR